MKKTGLYFVLLISLLFLNCTSKSKVDRTPVPDSINTKTDEQKQNTTAGNRNSAENRNEEITLRTEDGKDISAGFFYSDGNKETPQPLVILIHQFMHSRQQWKKEFIDSLLEAGFKVLAYDIRGHGKSSKQNGDIEVLLSDREQAPNDLKAVFEWTKKEKGIDTARIAAVGTSIGGNLALYAKFFLDAKLAVSISNSKQGFEAFTGYDERMMGRMVPRRSNVMLICGNKDGSSESDQKYIYDNFLFENCEMKVFDSDKHGMYLIEEHPEINTLILNRLKKYL